jgi:mycofactocin glycosyltransferase
MRGLALSLSPHSVLKSTPNGFFIVSEAPVRMLKVNGSLFPILQSLQTGAEFSALLLEHPEVEEGALLRTLLTLVARGYLRMDSLPAIEDFPKVSVIIPVKDQASDLRQCLKSLRELDYPREKFEIIVADDGSQEDIAAAASHDVVLLRLDSSLGPGAARNLGVNNSSGEILAFLDADCTADKNWLMEILPFFKVDRLGAAGGYVDSFYRTGLLDRYEEVSSSLNMGKRLLFQNEKNSTFYLPTCNLLVSRKAFTDAGGFKSGMRVGEDVDFCWRMRDSGFDLLYLPYGKVSHKHRNQLGKMLLRRQAYGTSESLLYNRQSTKRKRFPLPLLSGLSFLLIACAILLLTPYPLAGLPLFFGLDVILKRRTAQRHRLEISWTKMIASAARGFLSFLFLVDFHLMRYYLVLLLLLGILWHPLWLFCGLALIFISILDYRLKQPGLIYPVYLSFYILEHLAYQTGVFLGCLKSGNFRPYLPLFLFSIS